MTNRYHADQIAELRNWLAIKLSKRECARRLHVSVVVIDRLIRDYKLAQADRGIIDSDGFLTEFGVAEVRRLRFERRLSVLAVARMLHIGTVQVDVVRNIWSREPKKYKINNKELTISQIAAIAGVDRTTIFLRLRRGLTGDALTLPKYAPQARSAPPAPRRQYRSLRDRAKEAQARFACEQGIEEGAMTDGQRQD
jgi:hypothetical protein